MSIRLYNDALLDHAKNPSHPTEDDIPKEPKSPKKRKTVAVVAVVVVIVVIASVGSLLTIGHPHSPHIALISKTEAEGFVTQKLFVAYMNNTTGNSSRNITSQVDVLFYNNSTAGNISETILISSLEFTSINYSLSLYNYQYKNISQLANSTKMSVLENGTYDGFNFYYLSKVEGTVGKKLYALVDGVSGAYSFFIEVRGIPNSNIMNLIHDEIQAMTS